MSRETKGPAGDTASKTSPSPDIPCVPRLYLPTALTSAFFFRFRKIFKSPILEYDRSNLLEKAALRRFWRENGPNAVQNGWKTSTSVRLGLTAKSAKKVQNQPINRKNHKNNAVALTKVEPWEFVGRPILAFHRTPPVTF